MEVEEEEEKKEKEENNGTINTVCQNAWEPKFYYRVDKEIHYFVGHEISIWESLDSFGATIWPAALALCGYLDASRNVVNLLDKAVLEIGAGTGLVSIVASLLGAWVTATDISDVLGNLRCNLSRNTRGRCRYTPQVAELFWGYELEKTFPHSVYRYDYVLAADVVYHHDFLPELLITMQHFCQPGTTLIWANKIRFQSDLVFTENFKKVFNTTLLAEMGDVKIYMATARESNEETQLVGETVEEGEEEEESEEESVDEKKLEGLGKSEKEIPIMEDVIKNQGKTITEENDKRRWRCKLEKVGMTQEKDEDTENGQEHKELKSVENKQVEEGLAEQKELGYQEEERKEDERHTTTEIAIKQIDDDGEALECEDDTENCAIVESTTMETRDEISAEPESSNSETHEQEVYQTVWVPHLYSIPGREMYTFVGEKITIEESIDSYGAMIWPAALALCRFLETSEGQQKVSLLDKSVLEIGAGTGLLSIVATLLGARVTATDLPEILSNLRCNLNRNTRGRCRHMPQVAELSWGHELEEWFPHSTHHYDYILAADVVYHHDFLSELLVTMQHFCQPGTTLIWANKVRYASDLVFTENFKKAFHTTLLTELDEVKIYMATARTLEEEADLEERTKEEEEEEVEEVENEEDKKEYNLLGKVDLAEVMDRSVHTSFFLSAESESSNSETYEQQVYQRVWVPHLYSIPGREMYTFVGEKITIEESIDSYGAMIWPAALALCRFLETSEGQQKVSLLDKSVLEIGAGTGLLSIVATLLGARVTATDLPEILGNLRCNLNRNTRGRCRHMPQVAELSWGHELEERFPHSTHHYDYILAADVVYHHDFLSELLVTMQHFCQPGTTLIWANKVRYASDLVFTENFKKAFHTTLLTELDEVKIYMATARASKEETDLAKETVEEQEEKEEEEEENKKNKKDHMENKSSIATAKESKEETTLENVSYAEERERLDCGNSRMTAQRQKMEGEKITEETENDGVQNVVVDITDREPVSQEYGEESEEFLMGEKEKQSKERDNRMEKVGVDKKNPGKWDEIMHEGDGYRKEATNKEQNSSGWQSNNQVTQDFDVGKFSKQ
ncbi:uncharacterized protein mettl21ca [Chanos chanos]|uniref:Uncharacterized protein mettl21ca n=1 Tax=Chanos chanos TaxID=29144 RepID=A0A6J2VPH5_CHACN|nr:uncharacterized protein LOC115816018 [Chanos chanos]